MMTVKQVLLYICPNTPYRESGKRSGWLWENGLGLCLLLLLVGIVFSSCALSDSQILPEEIQFHGFMTQGFFHTSDNNVYGQSDDGISPGLTEIGLNVNYQPIDKLRFAAQGLYRRAGDVDPGSVRLDYGLADLTLFNYDSGKIGIRGGRIKIPFGLYNETRDVAFTHPTILLPQGIYFDRSRSLLLSADGGSFYAEHRTEFGDFNFKFNVGMPSNDFKEIKTVVLGTQNATGEFKTKPAFATQLSYEINGGEYIFAISYMDLEFDYFSTQEEKLRPIPDRLLNSSSHIQPLMISGQYNGEKFTLTGEYQHRWNKFGQFAPGGKFSTESWYVEGSYRLLPELQATVRYDTVSINKDDRSGEGAKPLGFPGYVTYAKDWVFGLRWDITPSWMVRGEYHLIHGTAWLPQADNPIVNRNVQDWDMYALQLSFKF